MKQLVMKGNASAVESAAKKFAVAGAIGLGVLAASERNAGAQERGAGLPPYEPMPVHMLGGRKQVSLDSETGSFAFNSRTARILHSEAMAGLSLDKEGDASLAIGPYYEAFIGYGTYRGPAGYTQHDMTYSGHSYGLGAVARIKATINGNRAELMGYGNAGLQAFDESLRAGAAGSVQHLGDSGLHMGRAGLELRMPVKARIGIGNMGVGMLSDPRNVFAFASVHLNLNASGQLLLRTTMTPHASMMTGEFAGGMDLRPVEIVLNRGTLGVATGPGLKYEYNLAAHASTMAPYMGADLSIGKKSGTHADISPRMGYITDFGGHTLPGGIYGGLQVGLIF